MKVELWINGTFKEDDFIYYLASSFDIKTLDFIKKRIETIGAGQEAS